MKLINFLLLLLLVTTSSCTITKRVHRKGFHIEWKKNYSIQKESRDSLFLYQNQLSINESEEVETAFEELIEERNSPEKIFNETKASQNLIYESDNEMPSNTTIKEVLNNEESIIEGKLIKQSTNDEEISGNGDLLQIIAITAMLLGLFLIIGSVFLTFGFDSLGGLFNALVFSGNGFIVGLFGFILFLIILVFILLFAFIVEGLGGPTIGLIVGLSLIGLGGILLLLNYLIK